MSTKWLQQSVLAGPVFVLTLLIGLVIPVVRPPADTEQPIGRVIKNASKLTETWMKNEFATGFLLLFDPGGRKLRFSLQNGEAQIAGVFELGIVNLS